MSVIERLTALWGGPPAVMAVTADDHARNGGICQCTWEGVREWKMEFCNEQAIVFADGNPYCHKHAEELAKIAETDRQAKADRDAQLKEGGCVSWRKLLKMPAFIPAANAEILDTLEELMPLADSVSWDDIVSCESTLKSWLLAGVRNKLISVKERAEILGDFPIAKYHW
jgi:hypothetical protein